MVSCGFSLNQFILCEDFTLTLKQPAFFVSVLAVSLSRWPPCRSRLLGWISWGFAEKPFGEDPGCIRMHQDAQIQVSMWLSRIDPKAALAQESGGLRLRSLQVW